MCWYQQQQPPLCNQRVESSFTIGSIDIFAPAISFLLSVEQIPIGVYLTVEILERKNKIRNIIPTSYIFTPSKMMNE